MREYFDKNLQRIKKGFYQSSDCDYLFYFTGKYKHNLAIFEKENEIGKQLISAIKVHKLFRISEEKVKRELKKLKKKSNWLEEKLKE